MKLEMMFIGALLFGLVFIVGLGIYGESLSEYNVDVNTDDTFGQMTYNLQRVYEYQENMKESVQEGSVTDEDAVDQMVRGGYTGIRTNPFNVLTTATNASMVLAKETGIFSGAVVGFLVTVVIVLTLFAIIALIFRFTQR